MDYIANHLGEIVTAIALMCSAVAFGVGTYIAVRRDLVSHYERIGSLEKDSEKIEAKLDRHVENSDIHYHRRETDITGQWPKFSGG